MSSEAARFPNVLATAAELRDAAPGPPELPVYQTQPEGEEAAGASIQSGECSDELLLAQVREGRKEALSLVFRRYARMVRGVAQRILRDTSEAEDLMQEVFLFVFRRAALFDPRLGSARSWLMQVTYHRAFDRRRHLMARHFYSTVELDEAIARGEDPPSGITFYEQTMEGTLGRETLGRIREALSADQQRVLRLHFVEGHTLNEIAALLGQTPGNVRNHYYRAIEKMRAEVFSAKLQEK